METQVLLLLLYIVRPPCSYAGDIAIERLEGVLFRLVDRSNSAQCERFAIDAVTQAAHLRTPAGAS